MVQQPLKRPTMLSRKMSLRWSSMSRYGTSFYSALCSLIYCSVYLGTEIPNPSSDSSFQVWLQYQCLWDMQPENIYNRLGEDLNKWQALLVQIRKARGTFDNAETRKEFGPVIIDYGKVNPCKSTICNMLSSRIHLLNC